MAYLKESTLPAKIDYTGSKFFSLTAICRVKVEGNKRTFWKFLCDCGNECVKEAYPVKMGYIRSCGCRHAQYVSEGKQVHGMSRKPAYNTYMAMMSRCYDKSNPTYARYGAVGVTVCDRWKESFASFWGDMAEGYESGLTLERVDRNIGYSPENCIWATYFTQARNRGKFANNTSGVTGVSLSLGRDGKPYRWVAFCVGIDGKKITKGFPIIKYGNDVAFELACECRKAMLEQLNKLGAGYSLAHGL